MDSTGAGKTLLLNFTGSDNPFANGGGILLGFTAVQLLKGNRNHFQLQIKTVQQRTGNFIAVPVQSRWRTGTVPIRVIKIAAWAGIHRSCQQKAAWKGNLSLHTGYGNFSVF